MSCSMQHRQELCNRKLLSRSYNDFCCNIYLWFKNQIHLNLLLFLFSFILLFFLFYTDSFAAPSHASIHFNDVRFSDATNAILTYIEGSFGVMIMVATGIVCICSAALGNFKASVSLLVVAILSFCLRSLVSTFFNDVHLQN